MAPAALRDHALGKGLGRDKRAQEVQVEHLAEPGGVQVEKRLRPRGGCALRVVKFLGRAAAGVVAAGAVDQKIRRPPQAADRLVALPHLAGIEHVAPKRPGGAAGLDDGLRPRLGLLQAEVQHGHRNAHGPQGVGHRAAQLAAAAGDGGHFFRSDQSASRCCDSCRLHPLLTSAPPAGSMDRLAPTCPVMWDGI